MAEHHKDQGGLTKAGDTAFLQGLNQETTAAPVETKDAGAFSKPARPEFDNRQLTLFQNFLCNTEQERDQLSNAIDLWDSVPRYSISRQAMTKARITERFLPRHETRFQHRGNAYTCIISPARVRDIDGTERDYYPSATEELVEDALRKLASDQEAGYFDKPNFRSGVVFTLYALREELKKRSHSRSYQEIVLALNVLSGSIIEIYAEHPEKGEAMSRAAYLPSLVAVSRSRIRDDPKAKWAVQFHPFVTGGIDKVTYRQFNYHLMMSHSTQLARWLHKQLVLKYTFASIAAPFEMRYSTVKRDSGLLDGYTRPRDALASLGESLKELQERGVLLTFNRKNLTGPRGRIEDAVFTLTPSTDFVRDTKAGSRRLSLAIENRPPKNR